MPLQRLQVELLQPRHLVAAQSLGRHVGQRRATPQGQRRVKRAAYLGPRRLPDGLARGSDELIELEQVELVLGDVDYVTRRLGTDPVTPGSQASAQPLDVIAQGHPSLGG